MALADLSRGLRLAGGVLNPEVQKETFQEDANIRLLEDRRRDLVANQIIRGAESGSINTDAARARLQELGYGDIPLSVSPEARARLTALENDTNFRTAMRDANGDMAKIANAAMSYGKPEVAMQIFNQQENRVATLQRHKESLAARQQELQMRMEDRAATREQQGQYQQMMVQLRREALGLQSQIAQGNQSLQALRIEMMGDKVQREKAKENLQITQKLGAAFEKAGLPQMDEVLRQAEAAIAKDDVLAYVNGPKSSIPDFAVGKEITDARQSVQKLFNITLKDRSGAAVTTQELERLKSEFGQGLFKTPAQLRNAVTKARTIVENHYKGIAAGFGKGALDSYNQNMEEIGGNKVLTGPSAPAAPGAVLKFDAQGNPVK